MAVARSIRVTSSGDVVCCTHERLGWWGAVKGALLPEGFPDSTTSDYLSYQVWDTIQALCSYVRGMLSQEAILRGVGVGTLEASALSAVTSFFVRDLTSMIAGISFTYIQGSNLDVYAKQWRLAADCLNNVGLALELMSPVFPEAFLLLASAGAVARAVTGALRGLGSKVFNDDGECVFRLPCPWHESVAGGATRTALTQHFSRGERGSPGDISAKEGSQEALTTLLGMLLGMSILQASARVVWLSWAAFLLLTILHVFANVKALRALRLNSLNPYRLLMLTEAYVRSAFEAAPPECDAPLLNPARRPGDQVAQEVLMSPAAIGKREPLLVPGPLKLLRLHPSGTIDIVLGLDLQPFTRESGALGVPAQELSVAAGELPQAALVAWSRLAGALSDKGFAIVCHVRCTGRKRRLTLGAVLGAASTEQVRACTAAAVWCVALKRRLWLKPVGAQLAPATVEAFITRVAEQQQSQGKRDIGVVLPDLDGLCFAKTCDSESWQSFNETTALASLADHGWDCSRIRWKCINITQIDIAYIFAKKIV